jgi:hypothetical protein
LLGLFSVGLGRSTSAHKRMFGLLGEKIGTGLPPIVMAPSAGIAPWIKIQAQHQPSEASLRTLEAGTALTIPLSLDQERVDDFPSKTFVLCPMSPWEPSKYFAACCLRSPND